MNRIKLTLFFIFLSPLTAFTQTGEIKFIENKGQFPDLVKFYSEIPGGRIFFQNDGFTYSFHDSKELSRRHEIYHNEAAARKSSPVMDDIQMHAVKVSFGEKVLKPSIHGSIKLTETYSYFYGSDPEKWASECAVYKSITYTNVFNNIDLKFYSEHNQLKYDLVLKKGSNSKDIEFNYQGHEKLSFQNDNIYIRTSLNEITENKPYAYTLARNGEKKAIECNYSLNGSTMTFDIKQSPVRDERIIIDPLLIFSTYSGSTSDNWGFTAAFDNDGNLYSGGIVFGTGFPATLGSFSGGNIDVGVLKYDSTGSTLIYAAYIGGNSSESPHSLIVNENNELIILGTTGSTNFPTFSNSYQPNFGGGQTFAENSLNYTNGSDIFVTKINRRGTEIAGSTYIGGSQNDGIGRLGSPLVNNYGDQYRGDINVDSDGDIYVASNTSSSNFPILDGFQTTYGGGANDGVVFKLNADLTNLEWSTFLGGSDQDAAYSIKFDSTETVYVAGGTLSSDYPTTAGSIDETRLGDVDGFIAKISSSGDSLLRSTYIGTADYNQIYFLDLDTADNVYVLGQTDGSYPFDTTVYHVPNSGQFIHKLSNELDSIFLTTTFGTGRGSGPDISPTAFLVNECGNIYVSGWGSPQPNFNPPSGNTTNLPVTDDAIQQTTDGSDFYLMVLERDFKSLLHATFFGGTGPVSEHVDGGTSRFDKRGIVYHAVCADCGNGNSSFPSTPGAYSEINGAGNCNNAAFKFDLSSLLAQLETNTPQFDRPGIQVGCRPFEVAFINRTLGGIEYFWNFGNGESSSSKVLDTVLVTYENIGEYDVTLIAIDQNTCKAIDRANTKIFVFEGDFDLSEDVTICKGEETDLFASGGTNYIWREDESIVGTTPLITVSPDTTTYFSINAFDPNGCEFRDSVLVNVIPDVNLAFDIIAIPNCNQQTLVKLINRSTGSNTYFWEFSDGQTSNEFEPIILFEDSSSINVTLRVPENNNGCTPPITKNVKSVDLFIPNLFTPNVDGINESFEILSSYSIDLKIFNRWGRPVFSAKDYKNDWNADDVGAGIYFYEVTFREGGDVCNGWVQVMK